MLRISSHFPTSKTERIGCLRTCPQKEVFSPSLLVITSVEIGKNLIGVKVKRVGGGGQCWKEGEFMKNMKCNKMAYTICFLQISLLPLSGRIRIRIFENGSADSEKNGPA